MTRSTLPSMQWLVACIAAAVGCATFDPEAGPPAVPEIRPGILAGYLPPDALPNSLEFVPPPPAAGSTATALDEELNTRTFALQGTPRWRLAHEDANLMFPRAAGTFSCALDAPITEVETPRLYMLLRRTLADAGLSTYAVKNRYGRARPFMANKKTTCTPDEEEYLRKDGSYPSGHAAIGWAWALILSEIAPERSDAILARGRAFGQSRMVCNVHWQSDVVEGQLVGSAAVARLHADPAFRADLKAATSEVAEVRSRSLEPTRDCRAEAEALAGE